MSSLNDTFATTYSMTYTSQTISNTRTSDTIRNGDNDCIPTDVSGSSSFRDSIFNALGRLGHNNIRCKILIGISIGLFHAEF